MARLPEVAMARAVLRSTSSGSAVRRRCGKSLPARSRSSAPAPSGRSESIQSRRSRHAGILPRRCVSTSNRWMSFLRLSPWPSRFRMKARVRYALRVIGIQHQGLVALFEGRVEAMQVVQAAGELGPAAPRSRDAGQCNTQDDRRRRPNRGGDRRRWPRDNDPRTTRDARATHFHSGPARPLPATVRPRPRAGIPPSSAGTIRPSKPGRSGPMVRGVLVGDAGAGTRFPAVPAAAPPQPAPAPPGRAASRRENPGRCLQRATKPQRLLQEPDFQLQAFGFGKGAELVARAPITGTEDIVGSQMMQQVFGSIALDEPPMAEPSEYETPLTRCHPRGGPAWPGPSPGARSGPQSRPPAC